MWTDKHEGCKSDIDPYVHYFCLTIFNIVVVLNYHKRRHIFQPEGKNLDEKNLLQKFMVWLIKNFWHTDIFRGRKSFPQ